MNDKKKGGDGNKNRRGDLFEYINRQEPRPPAKRRDPEDQSSGEQSTSSGGPRRTEKKSD